MKHSFQPKFALLRGHRILRILLDKVIAFIFQILVPELPSSFPLYLVVSFLWIRCRKPQDIRRGLGEYSLLYLESGLLSSSPSCSNRVSLSSGTSRVSWSGTALQLPHSAAFDDSGSLMTIEKSLDCGERMHCFTFADRPTRRCFIWVILRPQPTLSAWSSLLTRACSLEVY